MILLEGEFTVIPYTVTVELYSGNLFYFRFLGKPATGTTGKLTETTHTSETAAATTTETTEVTSP